MAGIYEKLMIEKMPINSLRPISSPFTSDNTGLAGSNKPAAPKAGAILPFIFHFVYFHILLLS